jgi:hypothetical protein
MMHSNTLVAAVAAAAAAAAIKSRSLHMQAQLRALQLVYHVKVTTVLLLLLLLLPGPGPYMSKPNEVYKPLEKALTPSLPSILTASGCWFCIEQAPSLLLLFNAALQPHASCVEYKARESDRVFYCGDWVGFSRH